MDGTVDYCPQADVFCGILVLCGDVPRTEPGLSVYDEDRCVYPANSARAVKA